MSDGIKQDQSVQVQQAVQASAETFQKLGTAITEGAKLTFEIAESFSKKKPGAQASMLGAMLLAVALLFAILGAIKIGGEGSGFQFNMDESITLSILAVGTLLIMAGGAFEVYFSIKISSMWAKKGEADQAALRDIASRAEDAQKESISVLDRMLGRT